MFTEFGRLAMWNLRRESQMYCTASAESQDYVTRVDIDEIEIAEDMCAGQPQAEGCCPYFKLSSAN